MLRHGDVETNDASAATDAGQHETTITNAHPRTATIETTITSAAEKHAKNARFSPAKALAVSRESFPILEGHDGAGQHTFACNSPEKTSCVSLSSLKFQALLGVADYRHQGIACEICESEVFLTSVGLHIGGTVAGRRMSRLRVPQLGSQTMRRPPRQPRWGASECLAPSSFARNSLAATSNLEFTSLQLQRLWMVSKSDRGKLRAIFVWLGSAAARGRYEWLLCLSIHENACCGEAYTRSGRFNLF